MKVLFVCLGNICRSPTAEGVMAQLVEAAKLQRRYHLDSAGTGGWHRGSLPDPRTRAAAARRGLDLTHRARQLEADDLHRFDHVVCMDRSNLANVERLTKFGGPSATLWLLRQFDPELTSIA